jgi:hypothetical protein
LPTLFPEKYYLNLGPIGDHTLQTEADQVRGKLARVEVAIPDWYYAQMLEIFVKRYGPPTRTETNTWRSKAGTTFNNHTAIWIGNFVSIYMQERGERVDRGEAVYVTDLWIAEKEGIQSKTVEKGASDLR